MNTMEHSVLKISPSQLLFGNSLDHDAHFISHPKENSSAFKYSDHLEHLLEMQERFLNIARSNQLEDDRLNGLHGINL